MAIQSYMDEIQKIDPISEEEQLRLLQEYAETQSVAIRNKLVEQNLKLVFKVASMYRRSGIPFADLVAEGNLGLIRGIEKYDLNKGVKLGYYLFKWISALILRHIVRNAHLVKMGTTQAQRKLFFNLAKTKAKARALDQEISDQEIAALFDVTVKDVQEMEQRLSAPVIRIETSEPSSNSSNDSAIQRLLQDRAENNDDEANLPDALFERAEFSQYVRTVVDEFMARLNDTKREVFRYRFLNENGEPDTFEAIGSRMVPPLRKQRIQQIDAELREKFRKFVSHNQIAI
ncbi:MAG: sigma-70 family RNA polymerase sigma factor [Candidatus Hermodarchaeia archaeon]|jgi:RNA polymerase sigma-32 factor